MRKIDYLNGLRGVAAFQVVFHHFILAFYPALFFGGTWTNHLPEGTEDAVSKSVFTVLWDGNFAVCIFFILSGFVLSHKFFLKKEQEIVTASAVKRYFRLALPVAFSILVAFVFMKLSLFYNQQAGVTAGSGWLSSFWTFRPDFQESLRQAFYGTFFLDTFDYNIVLWTIAHEFMGSFLIYAFLAIVGKSRNRHFAYAALIIVFWQTYYLAFILGLILSDTIAHERMLIRKYDKTRLIRTAMLLLGLFLGSFPAGRDPQGTVYAFMAFPSLTDPRTLYHTLGAFFIMIVLLESRKMQKFFSYRYFLFLGEISFAMYLLHFIILGSFTSFVFLRLEPVMPYQYAAGLSFAASLPIIFLASYVVYKYVDRNAVKFSHYVYEKFFHHESER